MTFSDSCLVVAWACLVGIALELGYLVFLLAADL